MFDSVTSSYSVTHIPYASFEARFNDNIIIVMLLYIYFSNLNCLYYYVPKDHVFCMTNEFFFYGAVAEWYKASSSGPMVVSSILRTDISVEVTYQC